MKKWKLIVFVVGIFGFGCVTGSLLTLQRENRMKGKFFRPNELSERMLERLQSRLDLTGEQIQKIQPVLESAGEEIRGIHAETMQQVGDKVHETRKKISEVLTPAQREKLKALEKEEKEFRNRRWDEKPFHDRRPRHRHPPEKEREHSGKPF